MMRIMTSKPEALAPGAVKFGTFKGVFLPSLLTIFGVILYLRMGWVAGHAGVLGTIVIVTLASSITFLTALSIASIATNMRIGAGGAYFMISRSLGLESGASVGVPLFLAQALGISFYISGFAESVNNIFPFLPVQPVAFASLVGIAVLAYVSADLALKAQFFILAVIIASLVSIGLGKAPPPESLVVIGTAATVPFWQVFAVFFPAVTGIEAGVALSGELKNPARSLPIGTIGAVLVGYVVYLALPLVLLNHFPVDVLRTDHSILLKFALIPAAVIAGIWGATLSSALGSFLGAPRTLQAMARDRVIPGFLGRGSGPTDEPRLATLVSFLIAGAGLLLGDLNAIAPVLSMFFLTSYGFLNLATAFESLIGSPSWRPRFRTPVGLSLLGAFGCFSVMLMIDAPATYVAGAVTVFIYWVTRARKLRSGWQDLRRGIWLLIARHAIYRLDAAKDQYGLEDTRTWRPNVLVMSGAPRRRWNLVELGHALTRGQGFFTVSAIVPKTGMTEERVRLLEHSMRQYLKRKGMSALVEVTASDNPDQGGRYLIESYGLGPISPNTILMSAAAESEHHMPSFVELIFSAYHARRNLLVFQDLDPDGALDRKEKKKIRVWSGGLSKANSGLMLALAYQLQQSREWHGSELVLSSVVMDQAEMAGAEKYLSDFLSEGRITAAPEVLVSENGTDPLEAVIRHSRDSEIALVGLRVPEPEETEEAYRAYCLGVLGRFREVRRVLFVLASQRIDFHKIFS